MTSFKEQFGNDFASAPIYNMVRMFSNAIVEAKTTEPIVVAHALEGMKIKGLNGDVEMRKDDHQMIAPLEITHWVKTNGKDLAYDLENTGYSFKSVERVDPSASTLPSTCKMKRPS